MFGRRCAADSRATGAGVAELRPRAGVRFRDVVSIVGLAAGLALAPCAARAEEGAEEHPPATDMLGHEGAWPKFSMHGFADTSFRGSRVHGDEGTSTESFAIGALDLCITSRLAENLSFLGEINFESPSDNSTQESVTDVERLALKYTVSDAFWVAIGRHHTPFGYWNESFHHGLWLQPIAFRPQALRFEDDGGILPVHSVGVVGGGDVYRGAWGLDYAVTVANGRAPQVTEVQNSADANDQKSVTVKLSVSHERNSRILFGPMYHHDLIPPDPLVAGRDSSITESIVGGHFIYLSRLVDVYSEYYRIHHSDDLALDLTHPAYYAIVVLKPGRFKPYAGTDQMHVQDGDPYYEAGGVAALDRKLVGVRWDFHSLAAMKFEYQRDKTRGATSDNLFVQVSFTF